MDDVRDCHHRDASASRGSIPWNPMDEQPDSTHHLSATCDPRQGALPSAATGHQCPPTGKCQGTRTCSVPPGTEDVTCSPSKENDDVIAETNDVESSDSDAEYLLIDDYGIAIVDDDDDAAEPEDTGGIAIGGAANFGDADATHTDRDRERQHAQTTLTDAASEDTATDVDGRSERPRDHDANIEGDVAAAAAADAALPVDAPDDEHPDMQQLLGHIPLTGLSLVASQFTHLMSSFKDFAREGEIGDETVIFGRHMKYWSEAKLFHGDSLRAFKGYAVDLDTQTMAESTDTFPAADRAAQSAVHELVRELATQPGITF